MLDALNRHVVLPLLAFKRRSKHFAHLRDFERSQWESPEAIRARQLVLLKSQLKHAWDTVPYYRDRWSAAGVQPSDVRELGDLQHFPVLTKAEIRQHANLLKSTAFLSEPQRTKTTSGSTGVPLAIQLDEAAAQYKYGGVIRADEWSGYKLGQRVAKVWGNPEYRHFGWKGRLMNRLVDRAEYLDTIGLDEARLQEFARRLRRHRPGLLFGHAHSLYLLACALKKGGLGDIRPNGIVSTAMPLHDYQRETIEATFGVPVTNRYGCEEVSLIASQCELHGPLHVFAESVFTEIRPLPGASMGRTGPLLVTDLVNRAMPLIRYQIGDSVTLAEQPCPCGRGLPAFDRIEGREADYVVTPMGTLISGISLTENFAVLIKGAAQVQIIQDEVTSLHVRMVRGVEFDAESERQIENLVRATFGPTMRYWLDYVSDIPQEPSGKYRFCISKVAGDYLRGLSA